MRTNAFAKFEQISRYPFFESVGQPVPETASQVSDWSTAISLAVSREWENCRVQGSNVLQRNMEDTSWDRLQSWDEIVTQLKPGIEICLDGILNRIPATSDRLKKIRPQIAWDILFICLEQEYSDLVKPVFFLPQLDRWYAVGHFPCGWDGQEFPNGWDGVIRDGKCHVF